MVLPAEQNQAGQEARLHQADGEQIHVAEENRQGFGAGLDVVLAVDHGVPGVVGGGPQEIGQKQQPRALRNAALYRCERHRNAPAEGDAEIDLRKIGVPFQVRVGRGQHRAGNAQQNGECVGQQHQSEGRQHHQQESRQRFAAVQRTARQRPLFGALDLRIQPAVGIVIDDAAGRARQPDADAEDQQQFQGRQSFGRQPQGPQGRPQQQQGPDRPVAADQLPIGAGFGGARNIMLHHADSVADARLAFAGTIADDGRNP